MSTRAWHVGRWGALGWVETALKTAAIIAAVAGVATLNARTGDGGAWRMIAIVAMAIATLGIVAAVADRLIEREIIAMVFVPFNLVGHLAAVALAFALPGGRGALVAYCALMALGDIVKMVFLHRTGFTVRGASTRAILALVFGFVVLYLVGGVSALAA